MPIEKVNKFGEGTAVLMNLSPQWYNAYRTAGATNAGKRHTFMRHVKAAGLKRWVELDGAGEREQGYEISYWSKPDRTVVFVCFNPEVKGSMLGGGNSVDLKTDKVPIKLKFAKPVTGVRDERSRKTLADGDTFPLEWTMNEAVIVSFAGAPPK